MECNKVSGTQKEMLEMVMKELVEEQAKTNRVIADLMTGVNGINNKIDKPAVIHATEPDTSKIQQMIEKCMLEIRAYN